MTEIANMTELKELQSWAAEQNHVGDRLGRTGMLSTERLHLIRMTDTTARHPIYSNNGSGTAEAAAGVKSRTVKMDEQFLGVAA
jgi:hypothetical protein